MLPAELLGLRGFCRSATHVGTERLSDAISTSRTSSSWQLAYFLLKMSRVVYRCISFSHVDGDVMTKLMNVQFLIHFNSFPSFWDKLEEADKASFNENPPISLYLKRLSRSTWSVSPERQIPASRNGRSKLSTFRGFEHYYFLP